MIRRFIDALSCYYEYREEIDAKIKKEIQEVEELKAKFPSKIWKNT